MLHYLSWLGLNFYNLQSGDSINIGGFRFKPLVGSNNPNLQSDFLNTAAQLTNDLKDPAILPVASTNRFLKATERLLLTTQFSVLTADVPYTDGLIHTELGDLRDTVIIDQSDFADAVSDYNQSQQDYKGAQNDRDKSITDARINYLDKKLELNKKLQDLDDQLRSARFDLSTAEATYNAYSSAMRNKNIVATSDGAIANILSSIGESVMVKTPVITISGN